MDGGDGGGGIGNVLQRLRGDDALIGAVRKLRGRRQVRDDGTGGSVIGVVNDVTSRDGRSVTLRVGGAADLENGTGDRPGMGREETPDVDTVDGRPAVESERPSDRARPAPGTPRHRQEKQIQACQSS